MKKLNVYPFIKKITKIINEHATVWNEACSYYENEKTQFDVFMRRVNKQIIQPYLSQFKLLAFSYTTESDMIKERYSVFSHFVLNLSFSLSCYVNHVYVNWLDIQERRQMLKELTLSQISDICIFDATKDVKAIIKVCELERQLVKAADEKHWGGTKDNVIYETFVSKMAEDGKTYSQTSKEYKKLPKDEKEQLFLEYKLKKGIPNHDNMCGWMITMLKDGL